MARIDVVAANNLLDKEFKVLDKGFIRLVDYMGGDARVVAAARVSYGAGTKSVREDRALIRYLMRNRHTSPFEQVVLTFHIKLPIFVARQWVRHRTARLNELSGRYSVLPDEFYQPEGSEVRSQSKTNRQGRSADPLDVEGQNQTRSILSRSSGLAYSTYQQLLDLGVARELARVSLPLSTYTQFYWQIDLHNLFHFLDLRLHEHAQSEIRSYARAIAETVKAIAPVSYEAFEEYMLRSKPISLHLLEQLKDFLQSAAETSSKAGELRDQLIEQSGLEQGNGRTHSVD